MNYTIDLVDSWAKKLVYRVLQISGASDEALSNYVKEAAAIKDNRYKSDSALKPPAPWTKYVEYIVYGVIIIAGYFAYKFLKRKKII